MADLTTYAGVDAELAATATYDVDYDVSLAKRRVSALRRKLDFASQSSQSGNQVAFQMQIVQDQLNQVLAWLQANGDPSNAQLLKNPSVVHADFSTFRGYSGYGPYPEGCH
jgi:hypothetical protein